MGRNDAATLALAHDGAVPYFVRVLRALTRTLRSDGALIASLTGDHCELIAGFGLPLHLQGWVTAGPSLKSLIRNGGVVVRADRAEEFQDYPIVASAPYWRWIYFHPIETPLRNSDIVVMTGGSQSQQPSRRTLESDIVRDLLGVIADQFRLVGDIASAINLPKPPPTADRCEPLIGEQPDTIVNFLVNTLVERDRVLSRNGISYHALKSWRKAIKSEQIFAMKALKSAPHTALEEAISTDLAGWIKRHFGAKRFDWIIPVPCGHSGTDCLSRRIALRLSEATTMPTADAFNRLEVSGSSHPRTNRGRPAMRLREKLHGDILLIDDVATSGSHIEEAMRRLRSADNSVVAVSWIADA